MKLSPQNFPSRLHALRKERRLTQAQLAKRASLVPAHVSHFESWDGSERGQRTSAAKGRAPSLSSLCALANALDVSADSLLS